MVMTLMIKIEQSRVVCLQPRLFGDYALSIAFSISLASALTSFFISFLARLVASSTARSIVASPTTINAASLSSSIWPTSSRSERDIPPRRWPMRAPAPAPTSPLTSTEGGKMRPIAAPTASPAQPPCRVGFSILSTIFTLPFSFLVITAASYVPTKCSRWSSLRASRSALASSTLSYSPAYRNIGLSLTLYYSFPFRLMRLRLSPRTAAVFGSLGAAGLRSFPALVAKSKLPRLPAFFSHLDSVVGSYRHQSVPAAFPHLLTQPCYRSLQGGPGHGSSGRSTPRRRSARRCRSATPARAVPRRARPPAAPRRAPRVRRSRSSATRSLSPA